MGRGSSKAGGGGGKTVTSVVAQSGATIDLTSIPLTYGKKDPTMSKAQRKTIEAFEAKRVDRAVEYVMIVDAQGNSTIPYSAGDIKGRSGSCNVNPAFFNGGEVLSHNHPRAGKNEKELLGGTFSEADLSTFAKHGSMKTIRATAAEGTYSMSKGAGFDAKGFAAFAKQTDATHYKAYKNTANQLASDFNSGKITYSAYTKGNNKAFNKMLVDLHNAYLNGQKTYDYTYTLEKR